MGEMLQSSLYLHGPPPTGLCPSYGGGPRVGLQDTSGISKEQSRGRESPPSTACHVSFDSVQDTVGYLGCKCAWSGNAELLNNQHPQVLLPRAAHNPLSTQSVTVFRILFFFNFGKEGLYMGLYLGEKAIGHQILWAEELSFAMIKCH